jgi:3-mercaptopyruvate sulfurtransferase SseA
VGWASCPPGNTSDNAICSALFNELKNLYPSKGITADNEVFPYCAIGGRSGCIWFVLKYLLGYPNVRNYDGSWNEWSRLPDLCLLLTSKGRKIVKTSP